MTLTKEEMQKQIEAVRGLIGFRESIKGNYSIEEGSYLTQEVDLDDLTDHLRSLTETLKPFLGDDKLEV